MRERKTLCLLDAMMHDTEPHNAANGKIHRCSGGCSGLRNTRYSRHLDAQTNPAAKGQETVAVFAANLDGYDDTLVCHTTCLRGTAPVP